MKQLATLDVGDDPDVLAFDTELGRLYVSAESGNISIVDIDRAAPNRTKILKQIGPSFFAAKAHTVAVDPATHKLYFPLESVDGKPVLRVAIPTDKTLN